MTMTRYRKHTLVYQLCASRHADSLVTTYFPVKTIASED
jgi:hypothetical protein